MKKFNKRHILQRILKAPKAQKRNFWAREMKALNDLLLDFESTDFWQKVNFGLDLNSLLFFKTPSGRQVLVKKYNEFNYKIPKPETYSIGKTVGENRSYLKAPKTIKDFLQDE